MRRPSLPQVVISVPCHVDWKTMTRIDTDGRVRFCASCARPVYDSAAMTRDELLDLIARHEGGRLPCIRLHRRPDGTIVTRDCFEPFARVGRFVWLKVGLAAAAFWSWALGIHPLARLAQRDAPSRISSEEMDLPPRSHRTMTGMIAPLQPSPPARDATLLARTPGFMGWPELPGVDRAAPLRTLEAEEEIWTPHPFKREIGH